MPPQNLFLPPQSRYPGAGPARPECFAINNYYISDIIKVKRGVCQGDLLSPTLFVLAIEWLAESLRQGSYQAKKMKDKEIKVSLLYLQMTPWFS